MFESAKAHATIAVSDLDRAKKFYEGPLGLKRMTSGQTEFGTKPPEGTGSWSTRRSSPGPRRART